MMRSVFVIALSVAVSAGYGPPRSPQNGCNGGAGCGVAQPQVVQAAPCGNNGCGGGGNNGGSGDYWWAGNNSPFAGPPASHVSVSSGSKNPGHAQSAQRPRPQQSYNQPPPSLPSPQRLPQLPLLSNVVPGPAMGICPANTVCVHWQLCTRNGFLISDGSGKIDKTIKNIPTQVSAQFDSCGGDMICCGIPSATPQSQVLLSPAPTPPRPLTQPARPALPAPQPSYTPAQPARPAPQPSYTPARPAPQPAKPAPQTPLRPVLPARPVSQLANPAPRPPRPAPQPARPATGYGRPSTPQNPLLISQPNPQPTSVSTGSRPYSPPAQPQPQPQAPISNPVGLKAPPNPPPPMMGMMGMMMGMPMVAGTCSAATYCVAPSRCNPYTGFIINDPSQLMAVWLDAPQVELNRCFVPAGGIQDGVCCQQPHPNAGGVD